MRSVGRFVPLLQASLILCTTATAVAAQAPVAGDFLSRTSNDDEFALAIEARGRFARVGDSLEIRVDRLVLTRLSDRNAGTPRRHIHSVRIGLAHNRGDGWEMLGGGSASGDGLAGEQSVVPVDTILGLGDRWERHDLALSLPLASVDDPETAWIVVAVADDTSGRRGWIFARATHLLSGEPRPVTRNGQDSLSDEPAG